MTDSIGGCHFFPPAAASAAFLSRAIEMVSQNPYCETKQFFLSLNRIAGVSAAALPREKNESRISSYRIVTFFLLLLHDGSHPFLLSRKLVAAHVILGFLLIPKLAGSIALLLVAEESTYRFGGLFQVLCARLFSLVTTSHFDGLIPFGHSKCRRSNCVQEVRLGRVDGRKERGTTKRRVGLRQKNRPFFRA